MKDWKTQFKMIALDKAEKISDMSKMPAMQWVLPHRAGLPVLFMKILDKAWILKPYGDGTFWDAEEIWANIAPVTLLHPKQMILQGDNRPIFDTEEELAAYEARLAAKEPVPETVDPRIPVPNPGEGWRLLSPDEPVEEDDGFWAADFRMWLCMKNAPQDFSVAKYPTRRRISMLIRQANDRPVIC